MPFPLLDEISRLETVYVLVPIEATDTTTGLPVDPTSDAVTMTFTTSPTLPDTPTWYAADWVTDPSGPTYYARCLVGPAPGVVVLAAAARVWATPQIVDAPEVAMPTASVSFRVR